MSPRPILAADVGGTQMRAALVDAGGGVIARETAPTPTDSDVPGALIDLIAGVGATAGSSEVSHAVVGLPGAVDYEAGRLLSAPNLPSGWADSLSSDQLSAHLGLHVHVANDADMAAVGEVAFGAGAGIDGVVAYLTISTGIGAGVVHRGQLVRGRHSFGEFGHSVVDWRSWREGLPGTLEELSSGQRHGAPGTRERNRTDGRAGGARGGTQGRRAGARRSGRTLLRRVRPGSATSSWFSPRAS